MAGNELADKLNRGRKTARRDPELLVLLARLKTGQRWMVETWIELRDLDDWGDQGDVFWKSFDEWDRLERDTRAKWKFESCVIGPSGCHEDAPIVCDYCAGRVKEVKQFRAMICDRGTGRPPKAVPQIIPEQPSSQGTLFDAGRQH